MISASRAGLSDRASRRGRRCSVQSGMIHSGDEAHCVDEGFPGLALPGQDSAALGGQTVEAAPSLSRLLHPSGLQPSPFLESIQEWIERGDVKLELPGRARLNQLAD